jgi:hypothetical protein
MVEGGEGQRRNDRLRFSDEATRATIVAAEAADSAAAECQ